MIAELGLSALWLAAAFTLLQVLAGLSGWVEKDGALASLIKPVGLVQSALCITAFGCLMWLFYITDVSVRLVAANSYFDKSPIFKLAGAWNSNEGLMLLWVTLLALAGAAIMLFEKRMDRRSLPATIFAQALFALGFFAVLLLSSGPFERLTPAPESGSGINPMLQDIGGGLHVPILYVGYVGLSVVFSFVVGGLLTGTVGPRLARVMRPWVLAAWIFLTLGIAAGSYDTDHDPGLAGGWLWGQVGNASLMPWLAATALLHSVAVLATRGALRPWTITLALVACALSIAAVFLVPSGDIGSVRAHALLFLYVGGMLALFGVSIGSMRQLKQLELLSREGGIIANNALLTLILVTGLVYSVLPPAALATGENISIGQEYFNRLIVLLAALLMLALAVGPLLRWRRNDVSRLRMLIAPAILSVIVSVLLSLQWPEAGFYPITSLALAAGLSLATLLPMIGRNPLRTPLVTWGMVIAHLGVAVSISGMAAASGWSTERLAVMKPGDVVKMAGWIVKLNTVRPVAGENWVAMEGDFSASRGDNEYPLAPLSRQFFEPERQTTEAALLTRWNGRIYIELTPEDAKSIDSWRVRLLWRPFVTLIWQGGGLIALGGLLALLGRMRFRFRRSTDENPWRDS